MSTVEIILLIAGLLAFIGSFFLPDGGDGEAASLSTEELRARLDEEIENSRARIDDISEESVQYSMERTERALDKIANEKIMAVGEYSDTVLNQIAANHQEAVFLHDMLNKNQDELTELLNRAEKTAKEANTKADEAYTLASNAEKLAREVEDKVASASRNAVAAEEKMIDARRILQDRESVQAESAPALQQVKNEASEPAILLSKEEAVSVPEPAKELSEEEMMEQILKEATAELKEDRRNLMPDAETAMPAAAQQPVLEAPARRQVEAERSGRLSVKRKPRSSAKKAEEILGQLSIPTTSLPEKASRKEELPPRREAVSLQFGQGGGDSANHNERILQMHRMGRSNMAIAKDLGLGIGEVKLVIDLYENT